MKAGFNARWDADVRRLTLRGDCRLLDAAALEPVLTELSTAGNHPLSLNLEQAGEFDIGPAWLLQRALSERQSAGGLIQIEGPVPRHFSFLDEIVSRAPQTDVGKWPSPSSPLVEFGKWVSGLGIILLDSLGFGGRTLVTALRALPSPRHLRIPSIVRHVHETGVQAIPVVAVIAFLISVISAYIGAQQLRPFGAEIYTVDLVAIGVLRELGVLLPAVMVAGRTGSAYAAEIGVMKLNDEVDALESMGLDPYEVLVVPRVIALIIAMPLLTIIADFMGLAGGSLLSHYLLDLPWPQIVARINDSIGHTTFWAGLVKAPVFGALIALTGTLRGLQVRESSRELGRLTTVAVVQSIFLVIFADALFAVFFLEIDF